MVKCGKVDKTGHQPAEGQDPFDAIVAGFRDEETATDTLVDDFDVVKAIAEIDILKQRMYAEADVRYAHVYSTKVDSTTRTRVQINMDLVPDEEMVAQLIAGEEEVEIEWRSLDIVLYDASGEELTTIQLNPEDESYVYGDMGHLRRAPMIDINEHSWSLFEMCNAMRQIPGTDTDESIRLLSATIEHAEEHMEDCDPTLLEIAETQEFTYGVVTVSYYRSSVLSRGEGFTLPGQELADFLNVTNEDTDTRYILTCLQNGALELTVIKISDSAEPTVIHLGREGIDMTHFEDMMKLLQGLIDVIKDPKY